MSDRVSGKAAVIRAAKIKVDEKPVRRRNKHKGSRIVAGGDVTVEVTKQNPAASPSDGYPEAGTVISGDRAVVETRMPVGKRPSQDGDGKRISVDRGFDATIFGRVRRRRR